MIREPDDHLSLAIDDLNSGDPKRLSGFWRLYGPILERIAERKMSPGLRQRFGAEDVAQSACRSFIRRAQDGHYHFDDSDGLWRLLCAITLTKVREKTRFNMRKERSLKAEGAQVDEATLGHAPDPAEVAEFNDTMTAVLEALDDEARQILELRLQQCTQEEIAEKLGISERTVRRILKRMQAEFESFLKPAAES